MARIARVTQKIFGSSPGAQQITQFGSTYSGATNYTSNIATIQALTNWLTGWYAAAIGQSSPLIEDMNAVFLVITQQLAYLLQTGIAEWDTGTTYFIGDLAQENGIIYRSLVDNNTGQDPATVGANWAAPYLPGVLTVNEIAVNRTVLSGETLTHPYGVIDTGKTLTVNTGGSFVGIGSLTVNGIVTVNGILRII